MSNNIVAVIFCNFDDATNRMVRTNGKPYFYLDPFNLDFGAYALVRARDNFAVVQVMRKIDEFNVEAVTRVTKPLLAPFEYDFKLINETVEKIAEFRTKSEDQRIQHAIDKELKGLDVEATPVAGGKKLSLRSSYSNESTNLFDGDE